MNNTTETPILFTHYRDVVRHLRDTKVISIATAVSALNYYQCSGCCIAAVREHYVIDGDNYRIQVKPQTEVRGVKFSPAPKQPKTFLWKSTDGRGEPSSTHTEEQIKQNWSLTDEDADGQTLEEFLELSENGDKWINGTEILENIS